MLLHLLKVTYLRCVLRGKEEQASQVDDDAHCCDTPDTVNYLPTQDGLLWIFAFLRVSNGEKEVFSIDIEIFASHFDCIFHFLGIFLEGPGLRVRHVHEFGEFVLGLVVGLDAVADHEEVQQRHHSD